MASQALVFEQSPIEDESFQVCKSQKEFEHEQLLEKVEAKVGKAVGSAQHAQKVVEQSASSLTSTISNAAKKH
jgi:ABC-type hemin transport system substrate-binding protein